MSVLITWKWKLMCSKCSLIRQLFCCHFLKNSSHFTCLYPKWYVQSVFFCLLSNKWLCSKNWLILILNFKHEFVYRSCHWMCSITVADFWSLNKLAHYLLMYGLDIGLYKRKKWCLITHDGKYLQYQIHI